MTQQKKENLEVVLGKVQEFMNTFEEAVENAITSDALHVLIKKIDDFIFSLNEYLPRQELGDHSEDSDSEEDVWERFNGTDLQSVLDFFKVKTDVSVWVLYKVIKENLLKEVYALKNQIHGNNGNNNFEVGQVINGMELFLKSFPQTIANYQVNQASSAITTLVNRFISYIQEIGKIWAKLATQVEKYDQV
jgi:hypothetical protein